MKIMKRSVSVLLAMLMIFSSFSLLASAADTETLDNDSIAFDTKFYRQVTKEDGTTAWEETTKAKPGESIKVRFFIQTGFVLGASDFFWLYSKNSITMSSAYTADKLTTVVTNPDENSEAFINEIGGDFLFSTNPTKGVGFNVVDYGYLPEDTYDNYGFIYIQLSEGDATYLSGDYWVYEFDFTVNKDDEATLDVDEGPKGPAQVYFPVEALITSNEDTWDAASFFGRHDASDSGAGVNVGKGNEESYDWDPVVINRDKDEDSTLSFDNTITFMNGTSSVAEYTGTIGTVLAAADDTTFTIPTASAAGQKFLGWSLDGTTVLTDDEVKATAYDYDAVTLTAVFESASASYVQNVYTMRTDGKYGEPKTDNIPAATDDKVKASDFTAIPDGFALDADNSTAGEVTVTADGKATLNIYLKRNSYDVVFNKEDGTEAAKLNGLFGATVTAPAADEKAGYTFAGWSDGENLYAAGADVKVPLNGATLTATYTPKNDTAYTVNIYTMDINGVYGEAEKVEGTVGTTGETVTYTAAPGEGLYLDEKMSTPELKTTITADDTDVINVYYARNAYEVKVDGVAQDKKVYHGATFTTPETSTTTATGYTLTGWYDGVNTYGKGEAVTVTGALNLTAVNEANDHEITYIVDGTWPKNYEEPAAEAVKYGATFKLEDLAEVAPETGFEFSGWTVASGATYDAETGLYTVTGDVEVTGEWTQVEYKLSYYLTEDDYTEGNAYETVPYFYGDTIEAFEPDQADILGKEFVEWETVDGDIMPETMPAGNLAVIASTNDYEVIFYDEYGDVAAEFYGIETVTEAKAPDMTSDEFDFGGWLVNGETDSAKAVKAFSYDITENYYFKPVCTVNVVYYKGYNEEGAPVDEYKTLTYNFGYVPAEDDAQLAALGTPTKEGHKFLDWDFDIVDNELTSHGFAVALWEAQAYTATFNAVNGDLKGAFADNETTKKVENVTYGTEITFADEPVLEGYTFGGWTDVEGGTVALDELTMDAENKTFYAIYTANGQAGYTVEIYLMGTDGTYADTASSTDKTKTGTIGVPATVAHDDYEQDSIFSADTENEKNVLSAVVAEDGSTVLKLYYKRATVKITINDETKDYYVGEEITIPPVPEDEIDDGYKQDGWIDENGDPVEVPYTVKENDNPTEIKPNIVPKTDTAYKVEIYLMGADGTYGAAADTKTKIGTTGGDATAAHADYIAELDAFYLADAENENNVTSDKIAGDGSTTLKLYYKRVSYEVKVDGVAQAEKVYHGAAFTTPTTSTTTEAGYTLTGWTDGTNNYGKGEAVTVTGALELTAVNTANTDTAYKVEIYLMGADGTYGAAADTKTKTGTTGGDATAAHADYIAELDAFYLADAENENNVTSDKIAGNGSTTLKLYYKRASYTYSFTAKTDADEEAKVVASGTAYHGATIKAPAYTPDAGYTFGGWTDGENTYAANTNITVESDLAYTAIITANSGIAYKVETHVMNTDGTTYEVTTETLYGKTGDPVSTHPASMEGFTPNAEASVLEGTIAADGSTVLKVVYDRNKYTIIVNEVPGEYYYGEEIEVEDIPEDEIPDGYEQDGWVDENGNPVTVPYPVDENNPTEIKPNIVPSKYTVEFTVNGKPFVSAEAAYGTNIENPGTPGEEWIPEGYSFGGWSVDGVTEVTDFGTVDVGGNTFVAILNAISYNLTFKDAEGNVLSGPTSTEFGSTLAALAPTAPDKSESGLIFAGWAEEADETVKMPATMPAKDVVYKATYVQNTTPVKYAIQVYMMDTNGNYTLSATTISYGYIGTTQTIEAGEILGCSVDTEKSHLSDVIASDGSTVLTIYYARDIYTVTFGDNEPVNVYYGAAIPVPADEPVSTEEGMVFAGWTPEVPATMPADNLVFEATWKAGVYTITYVINGETKEPISYTYGEAVETPETPNVGGLKFVGWTPEVPKTMPAEDLIIVATFEADLFKVTFLDDVDGEVFDVKYVAYGEAITLPTGEPTKEYHTFEGWLAVPETMPAEDITIVPNFVRVPVSLIEQPGSTTVIDRDNMVIYGLDTRMRASDYDNIYLDVVGDGYFTVTPADGRAGFYGTGTVISLYDNNSETGEPIEVYYVVIFGDVNGDSDVNAADASAVEDEYFWVTAWSREGSDEYAYYKLLAGDLDKDGDIDVNDHTNIVNYTVGVIAIDQTTGTVER